MAPQSGGRGGRRVEDSGIEAGLGYGAFLCGVPLRFWGGARGATLPGLGNRFWARNGGRDNNPTNSHELPPTACALGTVLLFLRWVVPAARQARAECGRDGRAVSRPGVWGGGASGTRARLHFARRHGGVAERLRAPGAGRQQPGRRGSRGGAGHKVGRRPRAPPPPLPSPPLCSRAAPAALLPRLRHCPATSHPSPSLPLPPSCFICRSPP